MEWQPIETAPDATDILLFVGAPVYTVLVGWHHSAGYFLNHLCEQLEPQPTHWMPLPGPPAA